MKLIIGLGNPGTTHEKNRHNAGYLFVEFSISNFQFSINDKFKIFKTDTFMNDSGVFVKKAVRGKQLAVSDLYIVHDDLDIPLGQYKIQFGVGPKVHNGISSVESALGGKDFWRIRIGVDNRPKIQDTSSKIQGERYVLEDFTKEELEILEEVYAKIRNDIGKY